MVRLHQKPLGCIKKAAYAGEAVNADDFSDMEAALRQSPAAPQSVDRLRPHFPDIRAQMVAEGFPRVPLPMSSTGVRDDMATNMFTLLTVQSVRDRPTRRQNAPMAHNLRNILWRWGLKMLRDRGWKV